MIAARPSGVTPQLAARVAERELAELREAAGREERPPAPAAVPGAPTLTRSVVYCPNATVWRSSCKRRTCPACGPRWARDWRKVMELNLGTYHGPVVLLTITAPGAEQLPWDEHECQRALKPGSRHVHSGKRGCRVQQRAARMWCETASWRWASMRRAASIHVRRQLGYAPTMLERVWELQRRGVPHLHLVLGYGSPAEIAAAHAFAEKLHSLTSYYGFGFVDRKLKPISAQDAARYLASYLSGRSRHKATMVELANDRGMKWLVGRENKYRLPLVWLTPRLTRSTCVTMRTLRRARHLWAAVQGFCPAPEWKGCVEAIRVGLAYRQAFMSRAGPVPELTEAEWQLARDVDERARWSDVQEWAQSFLKLAVGKRAPEPVVMAA